MTLFEILALLTYAFGIYAFGAILVYTIRAAPPGESSSEFAPACPRYVSVMGHTMIAVCFVWFIIVLLRVLFDSAGLARVVNWFDVARLLACFAFPPLIMQLTYFDLRYPVRRLEHPLWGIAPLAAWLFGFVFVGWVLLVIFDVLQRVHGLGQIIGIGIGSFFAVAGVYAAVATTVGRPRSETADQRASRRWFVMLYGVLIVFCLLTFIVGYRGGRDIGDAMSYIASSLPLLFISSGMYHENRFEFFDLFVKRGLTLTITVLALVAWFTLTRPIADLLGVDGSRAWIEALLFAPLVAAAPWSYRRMSDWIDAVWLGRRLTSGEAIKHFLSRVGCACGRDAVIAEAEAGMATIFRAPVRIRLGLDEASSDEFEGELEMPIRYDGETIGTALLGRRANRMPYFSQDRQLLASLVDVLAYMLENVRLHEKKQEHEQVAQQLSLQASRSELKALRAQINPHFLFNALNAIAGLIHKDPLRADRTVEQLAEIFRYTLRGSDSEWAVLADEAEFVRAYLDVERARFGSKLAAEVVIEPSVAAARVPTMMLQTLVENAVKHGAARLRGEARIAVRAAERDASLVIEVRDNGPGFDESADDGAVGRRRGAGFGLRSVRERLAGHFADRATLAIGRDTATGETRVVIRMPLNERGIERERSRPPGAA